MNGILIDAQSLTRLARGILVAHGAAESEAAVIADVLVWCDSMGRPLHGAWRLAILAKRISRGLIKSPCHLRFARCAAAVERLDADRGSGHYVAHTAMKRAIELARQSGVGLVGVYNSNWFGAAAGQWYA